MSFILKNSDLIDCWFSAPPNSKMSAVENFVLSATSELHIEMPDLKSNVRMFHSNMQLYWRLSNFSKERFKKNIQIG